MAICAVSGSRISPTIMMSGEVRSIERSAEEKVRPALGLICIWLMPGSRYSTGSSTVVMFLVSSFSDVERAVQRGGLAAAGGPGDQDGAVGPAERVLVLRERLAVVAEVVQPQQDARLVEDSQDDLLAEDRRQDRDAEVDLLCRRRSSRSGRPAGSSSAAMFRSDMIFTREVSAGSVLIGRLFTSCSTPSTR